MKQGMKFDSGYIVSSMEAFHADSLSEHSILNLLPFAIYVCDETGLLVHYNQQAVKLLNRTPREGDTEETFWHSFKLYDDAGNPVAFKDAPISICSNDHVHPVKTGIVIEREDGSRVAVQVNSVPIKNPNGEVIGAINLLIDVTESKHTEKALRESETKYKQLAASLERTVEEKMQDLTQKNVQLQKSEERYHKMVEEVEDYAILLLDSNGIIQNWNKGAEKIKGYKEEEIVGKSFQVFYLPEDRKAGLPFKLLSAARDKGKALHEGWRMRKDGTRFWGSIVLTALHNEKGDVIGFSKVTRDLTERKIAEDRLHEYTSQLEFQNRELEEFTYAASHDLKSPLRKIHFYSDLIAEDKENKLSESSLDYLRRSMASAQKMQDLIEDLLRYSKATSIDANFVQVDLNDILQEVRLLYKEETELHGLQILGDRLPVIRGIPFQIKQLLDNLINNSIKYKHPDRNPVIRVTSHWVSGYEIGDPAAEPYRSYVKLSLADNGIGFASEYSGKIFRIFQRLNMTPQVKGSGIGLAICKKIVQNHKGFISASGQENQGAQFDIYLPANL